MNVPKLRFPQFNEEWEKKHANEIFKNHSNKNHDGNLPILAVTQDKGVVKREDIDIKINTSSKSVASYKVIEPGDFVISLRSFQGGIEYSSIKGISSPAYTVLKPKINIDNNFYKFYLKKEEFISRLNYAVIGIRDGKQISFSAFSGIKLPYTSVEEQQKISSFLSKLDSKIEKLEKKQELWETYIKGIMQLVFSQKLRFKDENGEEYSDWNVKKLGDISDIKTGNKDLKDKDDEGMYPFFVRSNNVEHINSYSYDGEAILIPGDGVNVGRIYHYIKGKFDYHQRVYKISDFSDNLFGKYIYYYLKQNFLRQAKKNSLKASVDSLRLPTIKEMEINYPELSEQRKIIIFLSIIDKKIGNLDKELEINKKFKKGLLQQMFC